jgi:hypothetical protein
MLEKIFKKLDATGGCDLFTPEISEVFQITDKTTKQVTPQNIALGLSYN